MANDILVLNAGSSSIKLSLFESAQADPVLRLHGQVEGIGTPHTKATAKDASDNTLLDQSWQAKAGPQTHGDAIALLVQAIRARNSDWKPWAIGHRVVHGGTRLRLPVKIDADVTDYLKSLIPLAPLHQPANLEGIAAAGRAFPGVQQVACFDTAFHHGRRFVADAYALPRAYYEQGIRRYGFHGLSYEYVASAMHQIAPEVARGSVIACHLGNGASLCAMQAGRCVETTMGFTAVEGLAMGTRTGQLDPGVLLYLMDEKKLTASQISDLIYKQSGLLGLSGISSDMRDLLSSSHPHAKEAIDYFIYRVVYFIGALTAALGGLDGLVFTAGIGERSARIRAGICEKLAWLGLDFDAIANESGGPRLSKPGSSLQAWIVPTNEELMIARHTAKTLA